MFKNLSNHSNKFVLILLSVFLFSNNLFCGSNTNSNSNGNNASFNQLAKSQNLNFAKQKKSIAIVLSLFFGHTGAHRLYTGKVTTGMIQLLMLLAANTFTPETPEGLLIKILATSGLYLWGVIDLICILSDNFETADGEKLNPF